VSVRALELVDVAERTPERSRRDGFTGPPPRCGTPKMLKETYTNGKRPIKKTHQSDLCSATVSWVHCRAEVCECCQKRSICMNGDP